MLLQQQFQWYLDHQDELVKQYNGKYLVISGKAIVYSSENKEDACQKGLEMVGAGKFIVQLCTPGTEDYTRTFHTHRVHFTPGVYA
jgi:hypothetical protein